ncbi:MAG: pyridoxal 5'-phosphate synthase glutaminase subunit PdxT [bacterium]|nr:pyridoxal 5'-phosphate synthase glutaminase subunit PdxT [bacterium]
MIHHCKIVGVLSLQGDFTDHLRSLSQHKVQGVEVRTKANLARVDALILPGGESTVIAKLLVSTGLDKAIVQRAKEGMPIWGTCAGAILLAKEVISPVPLETTLSLVPVEIERNAYGRQSESFQTELKIGEELTSVFFIRAPKIVKVGRGVKVLAECKGDPVMVKFKNILITTFHSELGYPNKILEYFLSIGEA